MKEPNEYRFHKKIFVPRNVHGDKRSYLDHVRNLIESMQFTNKMHMLDVELFKIEFRAPTKHEDLPGRELVMEIWWGQKEQEKIEEEDAKPTTITGLIPGAGIRIVGNDTTIAEAPSGEIQSMGRQSGDTEVRRYTAVPATDIAPVDAKAPKGKRKGKGKA